MLYLTTIYWVYLVSTFLNNLVQILPFFGANSKFLPKNALHYIFEKTLKLLYALCHRMAGAIGLEPTTPGFGDRCSTRLSYTPKVSSTLEYSDFLDKSIEDFLFLGTYRGTSKC
jgi:hypothetical protein